MEIKSIYKKEYGKWDKLISNSAPSKPTAPADTVYIDVETVDGASPVSKLMMEWFIDTNAKTKDTASLGNNKYRITVDVKDGSEFKSNLTVSFRPPMGYVADSDAIFGGRNSNIKSLDFIGFEKLNFTNAYGMFSDYDKMINLDLTKIDASKITNMSDTFSGCSMLSSLDLSNFNTSNVTVMNDTFNGCTMLLHLNLLNFDTSNIDNDNGDGLYNMFLNCTSLSANSILVSDKFNIDMAVSQGGAQREWFTTDKDAWIGGKN